MAERETLARPYARAAFETAQDGGSLSGWSEMLVLVAEICADEQVVRLIGDPGVSTEDVAGLIIAAAGDDLDQQASNLVRVLAEARRLPLMPEITALFEHYRSEAEKVVDVHVRSAMEMGEAQQDKLVAALKTKLGREVRLHHELDPELIGGAVIRAGDLIIDGSVKERLNKLADALTS
jgi:F-type H+-transporting ATPase subunit delta